MISLAVMYELVIVAKVDKSDQLISRVEKALKDASATNLKVERLGRKQLAYQIKKQTDANYFVVNFDAEANAIDGFASKLRLEQEDLLRYLIIKSRQIKIRVKKGKKQEVAEVEVKEAPKVTVVTKAAEVTPSFATHDAKALRVKKASAFDKSTVDKSEGKKVSKAKKATKGKKS